MKKIFIAVLITAVAVIAGYGIHYANSPLNAVPAELMTHEAKIEVQGFVARDEKIYYAPFSGTVYHNAREGERVTRDAHISTVYRGTVSKEILDEIKALDSRIHNLKDEISRRNLADNGLDETLDTENKIKNRMDAVYDNARKNNVSEIRKYKNDINGFRTGKETTDARELDELEEKRNDIELEIGEGRQDIYTELSGTFTSYTDGLEAVLDPRRIEEYTPSYIKKLSSKPDRDDNESVYAAAGDPAGKVINDHVWYVIAAAEQSRFEKFKNDKYVKLRMNNMSGAEADAVVDYVSGPDENGDVLMLIRCNEYLEDAFSYRDAQAEVIFESYTGYKVPIQAVRSKENGSKYVIGASGIREYQCECEILYTDSEEEIALIRSTEDAEYKLSGMDRIIVGER